MPRPRIPIVWLLATALVAGCGDDERAATPAPSPSARPQDFPTARGKATLGELVRGLDQGPQLAPGVSVLDRGPNRFGFALFDRAGKQINGAAVAVYTASASQADPAGPFPARSESLAVKPAYASRQTALDPDAAKSVYVADVPFARRGRHVMIALARLDGRLVASSALEVRVGEAGGPPRPGQRAVRVSTPTRRSAGDLKEIETRLPPDTMHEVDLADALGRRPVVLVFATPQLCRSRVCGPIVDELEQLKARYGDRADFVHMEIYDDNRVERGFRPQVRAWRLPTEPWTFMIDRRGVVAASYEGAASVAELQRGIEKAISG